MEKVKNILAEDGTELNVFRIGKLNFLIAGHAYKRAKHRLGHTSHDETEKFIHEALNLEYISKKYTRERCYTHKDGCVVLKKDRLYDDMWFVSTICLDPPYSFQFGRTFGRTSIGYGPKK